jgi:hypothetical protein
VRHHTTTKFRGLLADLSPDLRRKASAAYEHLKANPSHLGLEFKKIGTVWSARIDSGVRALAFEVEEGHLIWFWIGHHDEYERIIRRR